MVHPVRGGGERLDVHGVAPFASGPCARDEIDVFEHSEVLCDGLSRHRKPRSKGGRGGDAVRSESLQEQAAVRFGEGREELVRMIEKGGSRHETPCST